MFITYTKDSFRQLENAFIPTVEEVVSEINKHKRSNTQVFERVSFFNRAFLDIEKIHSSDDNVEIITSDVYRIADIFLDFASKYLGVNLRGHSYIVTMNMAKHSYHVIFDFALDIYTLKHIVVLLRASQPSGPVLDDVIYELNQLFKCVYSYKPISAREHYLNDYTVHVPVDEKGKEFTVDVANTLITNIDNIPVYSNLNFEYKEVINTGRYNNIRLFDKHLAVDKYKTLPNITAKCINLISEVRCFIHHIKNMTIISSPGPDPDYIEINSLKNKDIINIDDLESGVYVLYHKGIPVPKIDVMVMLARSALTDTNHLTVKRSAIEKRKNVLFLTKQDTAAIDNYQDRIISIYDEIKNSFNKAACKITGEFINEVLGSNRWIFIDSLINMVYFPHPTDTYSIRDFVNPHRVVGIYHSLERNRSIGNILLIFNNTLISRTARRTILEVLANTSGKPVSDYGIKYKPFKLEDAPYDDDDAVKSSRRNYAGLDDIETPQPTVDNRRHIKTQPSDSDYSDVLDTSHPLVDKRRRIKTKNSDSSDSDTSQPIVNKRRHIKTKPSDSDDSD